MKEAAKISTLGDAVEDSVAKAAAVSHEQMTAGTASMESEASAVSAPADANAMDVATVSAFTEDGQTKAMTGAEGAAVAAKEETMGTIPKAGSEEPPTEEEIMRCFLIYRNIADRAKYIPLRLNDEERRLLLILEDALKVSEYTDKVDVISHTRENEMKRELTALLSYIAGMYTAQNPKKGRKLFATRNLLDNADFFKHVFEIGRRHKIRNPDKMRTSYGKLMFILMDIRQHLDLGHYFVGPILNVEQFAHEKGFAEMLNDPELELATAQIHSPNDYAGTTSTNQDGVVKRGSVILSVGKNRLYRRVAVLAASKLRQETAVKLAKKYAALSQASEDDVMMAIASIGDNHSYLRQALYPVVRIRELLHEFFGAGTPLTNNLAITSGQQGARLTHSSEEQFTYCDQTFLLWAEIVQNMFKLWWCAEEDMLDPANRYTFRLTGQGPNRVQGAPRVGRTMSSILNACYSKVKGRWIGSSAVHLGDNEVPNALVFIDKYTQVERILTPVVHCINQIDRMCGDPGLLKWLDQYYANRETKVLMSPGLHIKVRILVDFFRHAFDGSGADNYVSAGSCIDGRLTSAWNWCNKIASKSYYSIFLVSGFNGFEGNWSE